MATPRAHANSGVGQSGLGKTTSFVHFVKHEMIGQGQSAGEILSNNGVGKETADGV